MTTSFDFNNKYVLVVDDQRPFQMMLRTMLQNLGVEHIFFADNGEVAVRECRKRNFDILLVDYNLGEGKSGGQLLEELRVRRLLRSDALFFIFSGDNNKSMVLSALDMEPDEFITKPFSQQQLHNRLERAHLKRQSLQSIFRALSVKNYHDVIQLCQEQIRQGSHYSSYCQRLIIEAQVALGRYNLAENALNSILAKHDNTWARAKLGEVYLKQGNIPEAISTLRHSVKQNPLLLMAYESLARAYLANDQADEAIITAHKAAMLAEFSLDRQQLLADLAIDGENHTLAKESFSRILNLSRNSVHKGPQHLCNFIRSLLNEAQHEADPSRKNRLLGEVSSVLHHAKRIEGVDKNFDFEAFEGLSRARIHAAKGETLKAKRLLFDTNESYLNQPENITDALLPDTLLTLNDIGEYEYAIPLSKALKERKNIDKISLKAANMVINDRGYHNRVKQFSQANQAGIEAYSKGDFKEAMNFFNKALQIAPGNTGAILNKIQASLQLLDVADKHGKIVLEEDCKQTIQLLTGLKLSDSHAQRYQSLCNEFDKHLESAPQK